jgi:hypothetical protein
MGVPRRGARGTAVRTDLAVARGALGIVAALRANRLPFWYLRLYAAAAAEADFGGVAAAWRSRRGVPRAGGRGGDGRRLTLVGAVPRDRPDRCRRRGLTKPTSARSRHSSQAF